MALTPAVGAALRRTEPLPRAREGRAERLLEPRARPHLHRRLEPAPDLPRRRGR